MTTNYELAQAKFENEEYDAVIDLLKDSHNISELTLRANAKFNLEKFDGAIADCKKVLTIDKHNIKALEISGRAKVKREYYQDAIDTFTKLYKLPSANHYLKAYSLKERANAKQLRGFDGDYQGALEDLTLSLEYVDNIQTYRVRCEVNLILDQLEEAKNDCNTVLEYEPNDSFALDTLQKIYEALNPTPTPTPSNIDRDQNGNTSNGEALIELDLSRQQENTSSLSTEFLLSSASVLGPIVFFLFLVLIYVKWDKIRRPAASPDSQQKERSYSDTNKNPGSSSSPNISPKPPEPPMPQPKISDYKILVPRLQSTVEYSIQTAGSIEDSVCKELIIKFLQALKKRLESTQQDFANERNPQTRQKISLQWQNIQQLIEKEKLEISNAAANITNVVDKYLVNYLLKEIEDTYDSSPHPNLQEKKFEFLRSVLNYYLDIIAQIAAGEYAHLKDKSIILSKGNNNTDYYEKLVVFMSYPWDKYSLVKIIHQLAEDLTRAGVHVLFDQWHNQDNSVTRFTENVHKKKSNYVLVCGTPLTRQKWDNPTNKVLPLELEQIGKRLTEDPDGIIKILLAGDNDTSYPDFLRSHAGRDWTKPVNDHPSLLLDLLYRKSPDNNHANGIFKHFSSEALKKLEQIKHDYAEVEKEIFDTHTAEELSQLKAQWEQEHKSNSNSNSSTHNQLVNSNTVSDNNNNNQNFTNVMAQSQHRFGGFAAAAPKPINSKNEQKEDILDAIQLSIMQNRLSDLEIAEKQRPLTPEEMKERTVLQANINEVASMNKNWIANEEINAQAQPAAIPATNWLTCQLI